MSVIPNQAADEALGTCMFDIDQYLEDNETEWTQNQYLEFDNLVFNCAQCGWWCEAGDWVFSEEHQADVCGNCASELDIEDD